MFYLLNHEPEQKSDKVITKQLSGEKISHDNFKFSGKSISFKTVSEGKGEIETEIPKTLVPEAYDWINKVHNVTLSYGYMFDFTGKNSEPYLGVLYGYRIGRVTLGGGFDFSSDFLGVKAAAGFCW